MLDVSMPAKALALIMNLIILYYSILFFESSRIKKRNNLWKRIAPKHRFAILIPAHNEERVIVNLLTDLVNQDYPRHLYDVFVINDNSTDKTGDIVMKFFAACPNIHLIEKRTPRAGKSVALNFALEHLEFESKTFPYTTIAVFDADNGVEKHWLRKVDASHQAGAEVVQTNVATKNPNESLLTKLIYYEYLSFGMIWQLGKRGMGWCNALAGTGMSIRSNIFKKYGLFKKDNLTEDLELTVRLYKGGVRVEYLHNASVFDEKPPTVAQMFKQRTRWTIGHIQTLKEHFTKAFSPEGWDAYFYSIAILLPLVVLASWLISIAHWANLVTFVNQPTFLWVFASFCFIFMIIFAVRAEGDKNILLYIIPLHIFLQHWVPVVVLGLNRFIRGKSKIHWEKTTHRYSSSNGNLNGKKVISNGGAYNANQKVVFTWKDGVIIVGTLLLFLLLLLTGKLFLAPLVGA